MSEPTDPRIAKMQQHLKAKEERVEALLKGKPTERPCQVHPASMRPLDKKETFHLERAVYGDCPECVNERVMEQQNRRLHSAGVPSNLLAATLDNWKPRDATETAHLAAVRDFAQVKRGFLVLLGNVGTGKTHLAVGAMRAFSRPILFRQGKLLRALRETYRNPDADDPVEACQSADLFVLDEVGVSAGGRDEHPMLHEILDHRYGEFKPTILTTNCDVPQIREALGDRLIDRIRQAGFKTLRFGGDSHRQSLRESYLASEPQQPALDWTECL